MLSKAIRTLTSGIVETKTGERLEGALSIDRRLNVTFGRKEIRAMHVNYIIISDEEIEKVLASIKQMEDSSEKLSKPKKTF